VYSRRVCRTSCWLFAVGLFIFELAAVGEARSIRLRNAIIETDSVTNPVPVALAAIPSQTQAAVSGLYLVQFNGALEPARRAEMQRAGIELLQYVPDDAFIAKFNNVSLTSVAAMSGVNWVGPYRTEYKIQPRLATAAVLAAQTNETVRVNILLSPTATLPEIERITGTPVLCIYGADESDSLCPKLDPKKFAVVKLKGGHHFDGDYANLARQILAAANP